MKVDGKHQALSTDHAAAHNCSEKLRLQLSPKVEMTEPGHADIHQMALACQCCHPLLTRDARKLFLLFTRQVKILQQQGGILQSTAVDPLLLNESFTIDGHDCRVRVQLSKPLLLKKCRTWFEIEGWCNEGQATPSWRTGGPPFSYLTFVMRIHSLPPAGMVPSGTMQGEQWTGCMVMEGKALQHEQCVTLLDAATSFPQLHRSMELCNEALWGYHIVGCV